MSKKTIGIVGWKTGENSFGVTANYLEWCAKFGNPVIVMPWEKEPRVDLLILPGGQDVSASTYGETPSFRNSNPDLFKEHFFRENLKHVIEAGIPVFGICLGHQMLNIFFGGKLHQDLIYHEQSKDRWATAHKIYNVAGKKVLAEVNSHHHQAVLVSGLGDGLTMIAYAENDDDGDRTPIVEAMVHRSLPIASVQWHPKFFGAC